MLCNGRVFVLVAASAVLLPLCAQAQAVDDATPARDAVTPAAVEDPGDADATAVAVPPGAEPKEAAPPPEEPESPLGAAVPVTPEERQMTPSAGGSDATAAPQRPRREAPSARVVSGGAGGREEVEEIYREPASAKRTADAHVDRVLLMPTAETHPEGTLFLSSYELVFVQVGYALTDRIQVSLTTWIGPLFGEELVFVDLSAKGNFYRDDTFSAAAWVGITAIENAVALRGGVVGSLCIDETCRFSIHPSAMVLTGFEGQLDDNDGSLFVPSVGVQADLSSSWSLLLEAQSATELDGGADFLGATINFGARFSKKSFAVEGGFLRPFELTPFPIGFPWFSFTYRVL